MTENFKKVLSDALKHPHLYYISVDTDTLETLKDDENFIFQKSESNVLDLNGIEVLLNKHLKGMFLAKKPTMF